MMARVRCLTVLLVLALLFGPLAQNIAEAGLFSTLKEKSAEKFRQMQTKEWWVVKLAGKAVGFATGKAIGVLGAGVGAAIGFCLGAGPGAAFGAWLGYRITGVVARTFAKPVGEILAQRKLDGHKFSLQDVRDAFAAVDKKSLSAESAGAVLGDLLGGTIGVAAGLAFCAGMGPIVIPLIGAVSGAYLGKKAGGWLGAFLGRAVFRRAAKKSYEVMAPQQSPATATPALAGPAAAAPPSAKATTDSRLLAAQRNYEAAYQAYSQALADPVSAVAERELRLESLRNAQKSLETVRSEVR